MSERRERRRLHARARSLGVPIEQVVRRRPAPKPVRGPAEPSWPATAVPDRDDTRVEASQARAVLPVRCCVVTQTREVLPGGTVVMLSRHAVGCEVWSAR